jgi:hypothetical protein
VRQRREEREARRKKRLAEQGLQQRVLSIFGSGGRAEHSSHASHHEESLAATDNVKKGKVRTNMIRRTNNALQQINPSGHVIDHRSGHKPVESAHESQAEVANLVLFESPKSLPSETLTQSPPSIVIREARTDSRNPSVDVYPTLPPSPHSDSFGLSMMGGLPTRNPHHQPFSIAEDRETFPGFQRTHTVEFSLSRQTHGASPEMGGGVTDTGRLSLVGSREGNEGTLNVVGDNTNRSHRGDGLERCKGAHLLGVYAILINPSSLSCPYLPKNANRCQYASTWKFSHRFRRISYPIPYFD